MIRRVSSTTVRPTSSTVAGPAQPRRRGLEHAELGGARLGLLEQLGVGQRDRRVRRQRRDEGDVAARPVARLVGDGRQRADDPVVVDQRRDELAGELEDVRRTGRSRGCRPGGRPGRRGRGRSAGPRRPSPRRGGRPAGGRRLVGQPGPGGEVEAVVLEDADRRAVGAQGAPRLVDDRPEQLLRGRARTARRSAMPRTESSRSASSISSERSPAGRARGPFVGLRRRAVAGRPTALRRDGAGRPPETRTRRARGRRRDDARSRADGGSREPRRGRSVRSCSGWYGRTPKTRVSAGGWAPAPTQPPRDPRPAPARRAGFRPGSRRRATRGSRGRPRPRPRTRRTAAATPRSTPGSPPRRWSRSGGRAAARSSRSGSEPPLMCHAPGTWPASYSDACRTSMTQRGRRRVARQRAAPARRRSAGRSPRSGGPAPPSARSRRRGGRRSRRGRCGAPGAIEVVQVGLALDDAGRRAVEVHHPAEPRPERAGGGIESEPGMCPATCAAGGRASTSSAPPATAASTASRRHRPAAAGRPRRAAAGRPGSIGRIRAK